jgi:predicted outer membrane protein
MRLKAMKTEELRAEAARLKAGNVGTGFDKQYLQQAEEMVSRELKTREKQEGTRLPHEQKVP